VDNNLIQSSSYVVSAAFARVALSIGQFVIVFAPMPAKKTVNQKPRLVIVSGSSIVEKTPTATGTAQINVSSNDATYFISNFEISPACNFCKYGIKVLTAIPSSTTRKI
jgi:hypothetical protein